MELGRGDSVTKLHCYVADAVYVLTHTQKVPLDPDNIKAIKKLKQKHAAQDQRELANNKLDHDGHHEKTSDDDLTDTFENSDGTEGGALWDIFRRQDIHKLEEYLKKHYKEFRHIHCSPLLQVSHPIHDQTFYLSMDHKRRLKKEYGIEPWTFTQKLGDAVIIPAGCPYQIRNLKSCISVALDFISPESVNEAIRLTEEFRHLPEDHISKEDRLEVKKLILHSLKSAIKDFEKVPKLDRDIHIKDSSSLRSLGRRKTPNISPNRMHSSSPQEVACASCKQENSTTPVSCQIEKKNVDMEKVESTLKKPQSVSAAKRNRPPNSLSSEDASKDSLPLMHAKEILDDFKTFPQKVFGNLFNEMTTLNALSMLSENLSLFDEKEAKLIIEIKEILSLIEEQRELKKQFQKKYEEELSESEKCGNNVDNLVNSVMNMKVEYDELQRQVHELEKQKKEMDYKIMSTSDMMKRIVNKIKEEATTAKKEVVVAEDKEAKTEHNKQKMADVDSLIDRELKNQFQKKYEEESSESEKCGNNFDNLANSVMNMKVEYDKLRRQVHELEKQKKEINHKIMSTRDMMKRTVNKIKEEAAMADQVLVSAEDKEAKAVSNKQKMAEADSLIDSLKCRFYAFQSQY